MEKTWKRMQKLYHVGNLSEKVRVTVKVRAKIKGPLPEELLHPTGEQIVLGPFWRKQIVFSILLLLNEGRVYDRDVHEEIREYVEKIFTHNQVNVESFLLTVD